MFHKIYSGLFLLICVFLVASLSTAYMTFAFLIGTPMAIAGSNYWLQVWIGFDKLCNAALGGITGKRLVADWVSQRSLDTGAP